MSLDVSGYSEDIVKWAESPHGFYVPETKKPIVLTDIQKRILRHVFQPDSEGIMPYETVLYSCPKKSGKSTLAALVTLWWALTQEATNVEVFIAANDLDQSRGRVYKAFSTAIQLNPYLRNSVDVGNRRASFSTGTIVEALPSEFRGAAGNGGANYLSASHTEAWAICQEGAELRRTKLSRANPTRTNLRGTTCARLT